MLNELTILDIIILLRVYQNTPGIEVSKKARQHFSRSTRVSVYLNSSFASQKIERTYKENVYASPALESATLKMISEEAVRFARQAHTQAELRLALRNLDEAVLYHSRSGHVISPSHISSLIQNILRLQYRAYEDEGDFGFDQISNQTHTLVVNAALDTYMSLQGGRAGSLITEIHIQMRDSLMKRLRSDPMTQQVLALVRSALDDPTSDSNSREHFTEAETSPNMSVSHKYKHLRSVALQLEVLRYSTSKLMEQAERAEYVSFATVKQMFEQTYICVQIARKSFPKCFSNVPWESREVNGQIPESVQNILTSMSAAHEWALRWNKNNAVYAFHRHKGETLQSLPVYCKLLTSQLYQQTQTYNTTLAISKTLQASLPAQAVQDTCAQTSGRKPE
jgi:hypothetical protein